MTSAPPTPMRSFLVIAGLTALTAAVVHTQSGPPASTGVRSVDEGMLRTATAGGEWLTHGGDYAETRHSTLAQITSATVSRLGLAWSVEVGSEGARVEATPLVSDGVMYLATTWNVVYAIDLRTRTIKWRWDPGLVRGAAFGGTRACCGPVNRGLSIYQDKVFIGLFDGRLAALDAHTGRVVWVVQTTPHNPDYSITGATRVIKGKVIIGNGGGDAGVRGFITAYDAETGRQAWRFYTVPGDPSQPFEHPDLAHAATTWNGEWWNPGGGGTAWDAIAYDPEADLLYVGTGNGGPWNRDTRSPGGGDNLYLASILALRPDTGELVWYYQTTPGESWDFTAVQNIVLADLTIGGRERKVLMQAPKNGFFYVLDRLTGEFLSGDAISRLNWASGIDATGRPIETPNARYPEGAVEIYPGPRGAHNWHPMSFSPDTGLVYIPGQENSFVFRADRSSRLGIVFGGGGRGGAPTPSAPPIVPPSIGAHAPPGEPGFLLAWDPVAQKERWRVRFTTRENSGTLSTAGGLVFHGSATGVFAAHDAQTGATLWQTQIYNGIASPITYEIDGQQYVAVLSGTTTNRPPGRVLVFALDGQAAVPGLQ